MMTKFVVFVACLAFANAGLVRRDAPPTILEQIQKHANEFKKTFDEQLKALTDSKNSEELNKALKENSEVVVKQINAFSNSLQSALSDASGKAKEALEQTRQNLAKTVEDLKKAHPDVEQQAKQLREKIQVAVKSTAEQTEKLAKEVGQNLEQTNEKLAPKIKAAYDDFVKEAQEVQKKLQEAANSKQ